MAEHLLDAPQIRASFEQVRREGVAEEMRVDAGRVEPGPVRELAEDEEGARAGQRATPRVQEELGPVAPVEVGPPEREVAPHGFRRRAPEGDDPLLSALSHDADDPRVDVDAHPLKAHRLGDAEARAVEELHERAIAERARRGPRGGVDEALGLGG